MGLHFDVADFLANQHCSVGICLRGEAVATHEQGTQALSGFDPIRGRMLHFAPDRNRCAQVIPLRDLPDGKNISVAKRNVFVDVSRQRGCELHLHALGWRCCSSGIE